jgi:hypothetical protein
MPVAMRFAVSLMRYRGRPLSRDELANRAPYVGELGIEETHDPTLLRHVRIARLLAPDAPRAPLVLCELLEPSLIAMSPQAFTLSGFERPGDACYAQSWLVRRADHAHTSIGVGAAFRPVTRIVVPDRG